MSNITNSEKAIIIAMARYYIHTKNATLKAVGERFDVSSKTVSNYLNEELKYISPKLYGKVQGKKAANVLKARNSFKKKKECWLVRFFKRK